MNTRGGAVGKRERKTAEIASHGGREAIRRETSDLSKSPPSGHGHRNADIDGHNEQLAEAVST